MHDPPSHPAHLRAVPLAVGAALLLAAAMPAATAMPAPPPPPTWAPAADATIHPGVQTYTAGAQCTANFVFYDTADVYLGQAAHCASLDSVVPDGCNGATLPLGTQVDVQGASQPATLVYSSWQTMQDTPEVEDLEQCRFNDFALIRLDRSDHGRVNPTLPWWGGPVGRDTAVVPLEAVYSYGRSALRRGLEMLDARQGIVISTSPEGWDTVVVNLTPALPGDSGSAVLDADGNAVGVVTTLQILPLAGSNGVVSLQRALTYMEANTDLDVTLARGTEPFDPGFPLLGFLLG